MNEQILVGGLHDGKVMKTQGYPTFINVPDYPLLKPPRSLKEQERIIEHTTVSTYVRKEFWHADVPGQIMYQYVFEKQK